MNKIEDNQGLQGKELYEFNKAQKQSAKYSTVLKEKLAETPKKIGRGFRTIIITIIVTGGIGFLMSLTPNLPPTSQQNHSEDIPESHILTTPMPDVIQRHMLEHADGKDVPGVLVQYNCDDYSCKTNLVEKLTTLVEQYPINVYLSPNDYDGKIILTSLGRREILDSFDEQTIKNFIK